MDVWWVTIAAVCACVCDLNTEIVNNNNNISNVVCIR